MAATRSSLPALSGRGRLLASECGGLQKILAAVGLQANVDQLLVGLGAGGPQGPVGRKGGRLVAGQRQPDPSISPLARFQPRTVRSSMLAEMSVRPSPLVRHAAGQRLAGMTLQGPNVPVPGHVPNVKAPIRRKAQASCCRAASIAGPRAPALCRGD